MLFKLDTIEYLLTTGIYVCMVLYIFKQSYELSECL